MKRESGSSEMNVSRGLSRKSKSILFGYLLQLAVPSLILADIVTSWLQGEIEFRPLSSDGVMVLIVAGIAALWLLAGVGLNTDSVGFDGDGFLSAAELHLKVDTSAITDLKDDTFLFGDFEAGGFGFCIVVPDFEFGNRVLARVAGYGGVNQAGFEVGKRDFYVRNGGAGGIGDGADDGGVLCHHRRREAEKRESENYKVKRTDVFESIEALDHPQR